MMQVIKIIAIVILVYGTALEFAPSASCDNAGCAAVQHD